MPRLLSLLVFALFCAASQVAWAQTIQPIQSTAVSRQHEAEDRQSGEAYFYISREDCLASDVLTFDLDILGPDSSSTFQVWAGDDDDCTDENYRGGDDARCWLVYEGTLDQTSEQVSIPVQNIAARRLPQVTSGGISVGTLESCANDIELGITLFFMHVSGGATSGNVETWNTQLDLKGPAAPTDVEAGIGDKRLIVSWEPTSGTRSGYKIYCEGSTTDVSELGEARFGQLLAAQNLDGGLSGGGSGGSATVPTPSTTPSAAPSTTPSTAPSTPGSVTEPTGTGGTSGGGAGSGFLAICATNLREGVLPPADAEVCGEVEVGSSEKGTADGLENSVVYAVGVAAVDELGNPGPLSNIDCEAPEDLDEFFEAYRRLGGKGGGGFCSVARVRTTSSWLLVFAAVATTLSWALRRASR